MTSLTRTPRDRIGLVETSDDAANETALASRLQGSLRPSQFFTIGLGAIIGVGWAIVLGAWLTSAGPAGAMLGFLIGAVLMLPIAACYAELATVIPSAGGEVVYTLAVFGRGISFATGWFIVTMTTSLSSFEGISLAWFSDRLFPGVQGPVAYSLFGADVHYTDLVIGSVFMVIITLVNYLGAYAVGRFQDFFTYLKAGAIVIFVVAAFMTGNVGNLQPLWTPIVDRPEVIGILWIAATGPVFYGGFQVIPQAVEERTASTSLNTIGKLTVLPVILGLIFYCLVITASCLVVPWRTLAAAPLPAAMAVQTALGNVILAKVVIGAIVLGVLATWNAVFLWGTRLMLALGRESMIPKVFARTGRFQSPGASVLFVGALGLVGLCLGRGAIVPMINMAAISLAFSYVACCWAVLRLRRLRPHIARPFRVPGTPIIRFAIGAAAAMAVITLLEPATRSHGMPLEWTLMLVWSALGFGFARLSFRRQLLR